MDECSLSYAKLPELKRSSLTQKTADQSNKHTRETISVTYICIQLPTSNLGNDLVTELLLKSALSCLLQIEQFYANCLVSTSLPISLHIFRYFFIFLDQLHCKSYIFAQKKHSFYTSKAMLLPSQSNSFISQIDNSQTTNKGRLELFQSTFTSYINLFIILFHY